MDENSPVKNVSSVCVTLSLSLSHLQTADEAAIVASLVSSRMLKRLPSAWTAAFRHSAQLREADIIDIGMGMSMHSRLFERTSTQQARIESSDKLETFRIAEWCLKPKHVISQKPIPLFPCTLSTLSSSCILCIFAKASGGTDILQCYIGVTLVMFLQYPSTRFDQPLHALRHSTTTHLINRWTATLDQSPEGSVTCRPYLSVRKGLCCENRTKKHPVPNRKVRRHARLVFIKTTVIEILRSLRAPNQSFGKLNQRRFFDLDEFLLIERMDSLPHHMAFSEIQGPMTRAITTKISQARIRWCQVFDFLILIFLIFVFPHGGLCQSPLLSSRCCWHRQHDAFVTAAKLQCATCKYVGAEWKTLNWFKKKTAWC